VKLAACVVCLVACVEPGLETETQEVSTAVRHERYGLIRDAAAEMGLYNAPLLAGIAISETNLAHCQAEATYACKGPASPSCGGGPIIAGAADGPCDLMQGGLGMFQFDAGTYSQTVTTYGESILTIEGNTAQAVNFVVERAIQDIDGVTDWLTAVAWMNAVPMDAAGMQQWASFIVCRYNGCCTTSSTCVTRANGYRDNALMAFEEMGADFWNTSTRCAKLPDDGIIDQRSECYLAGGDPRYWHVETGGYGDDREWTGTTSASNPANFARWLVRGASGHYHVEVHLDAGEFGASKQASYEIHHAGVVDTVVVDQSANDGWFALGDFEFSGEGDEFIALGDNTGEPAAMDIKLLFDAVKVESLDRGGGCCGASSHPASALLLALVVLALIGRRRR